jgi:radical SAM superfamily enzyme YgiQ (UPF0313 family)
MHITFVAIGWEQLSVSLLSAIAKEEGYTTSLAFSRSLFNDRYNIYNPGLASFFDDTKDVIKSIEKERPDIVAFSPVTSTYQWMLEVAGDIKKRLPQVKIIFGGVHVSAVPERVLRNEFVDYIVVGEGEFAFRQILFHIKTGSQPGALLANTLYKTTDGSVVTGPRDGFISDLDELPVFDKQLWEPYMRFNDLYFTITSRGCPYKCTYCFNSFFSDLSVNTASQYIRQRSPEHVMLELISAKKRYNPKIIEFEDDVFSLNKSWLKDLLAKYRKEIKIPYQCMTHPRFLDEETGRMLAESGCVFVQMGVQSMDDVYKKEHLRRPETTADIEKALSILHKNRIKVKVDHMFALPNEPLEAQEKACQIYTEYKPFRIQTFWTIYLPGTEMLTSAVDRGLLTNAQMEAILDGNDQDFFRNSNKLKEPEKFRIYKSYELYFKLITIIPKFIIKKFSPKLFIRLPQMFTNALILVLDVLAGLIKGNPDHIYYAKYYIFNIGIGFMKKIGYKKE